MHNLLKVAVVGTARMNQPLEAPASAIERAIAQLDAPSVERRLLLAAGLNAIRWRAGVQPLEHTDSNDVADDETWAVAPERVALLISELLHGPAATLLPEALDRLRGAKLLIPPGLLAEALDAGTRNTTIRPLLKDALGERGRWLARWNTVWSWAATPSDDELAAAAETTWQEGKKADRLDTLRLMRVRDPAHARELLESTWQHERATVRADAIDILGVNLSAADQLFLEDALKDRAQAVREHAEALLLRIPGSRIAHEAVMRAEPLLGKRLGIQIVIRPPESDDASSDTERAAELTEIIGRVPPSHWVAELGKQPADLVKSVAKDRDWGFSVISGWTQAALTFTDADWAAALWPFWMTVTAADLGVASKLAEGTFAVTVNRYAIALLHVMRPNDAEHAVSNHLVELSNASRTAQVLLSLERPWSVDFADLCIREIGHRAGAALNDSQLDWQKLGHWVAPLQAVTLGLPATRIETAIALMNRLIDTLPPDDAGGLRKHWRQILRSHIDTLHVRRRIYEEIPE